MVFNAAALAHAARRHRPSRRGAAPLAGRAALTTALALAALLLPGFGGKTAGLAFALGTTPAPAPTANPAAPPHHTFNVQDFGAKGDGVTFDSQAIQRALNAAQPHDDVYLPAGTYLLDAQVNVQTNGLTLRGDGNTTVLKLVPASGVEVGVQIGTPGQPRTGILVTHLEFLGQPGKYLADGNTETALLVHGAMGTKISACDFVGCGNGIYQGSLDQSTAGDDAISYGNDIEDCRFRGWGSVAISCSGGEIIAACSLVQDDPDLSGQHSSHGIDIHAGSHDILVSDTVFQNVRKDAAQLYGQTVGSTISHIKFVHDTFSNCSNGLVIANNPANAAVAKNILVQACDFTGIYGGPSVSIKQGDTITVQDNTIDGGPVGIGLGRWASGEAHSAVISNLIVSDNMISNCDMGIDAETTNGGQFQNVSLYENLFTNCRAPVTIAAPGGGVSVIAASPVPAED